MENYVPFSLEKIKPISGQVSASVPSNIALVKYWGKTEGQIPCNPSISYTLDKCRTNTTVYFQPKQEKNQEIEFSLLFENKQNEAFTKKVSAFFLRISVYCPYLLSFTFDIHTQNTFPHSSGIASSASGMGALASCLVRMEQKMGACYSEQNQLKRASFLARLGSGSACRSIYPGLVLWGKHPQIPYSSNLIAQPLNTKIHPVFRMLNDTILVVDKEKKAVSSSQGHALMNKHPFAKQRFKQAFENIVILQTILKSGDLQAFGELIESEALTLHAMMMSSRPYFILISDKTLQIIRQVQNFRKESNFPLYFTLDAGANVHLLYPKKERKTAKNFIEKKLLQHCEDRFFIDDILSF